MRNSIGTKAAAEILSCDRSTIRAMCKDEIFPSAKQDKSGSSWHISEQEVRELNAWRAGRKAK